MTHVSELLELLYRHSAVSLTKSAESRRSAGCLIYQSSYLWVELILYNLVVYLYLAKLRAWLRAAKS